MANDEKYSDITFSNKERDCLEDLATSFEYLVCYSPNYKICSVDMANKILQENTIFKDVYYLQSKDCQELINDNEELKDFIINGKPYHKMLTNISSFIALNQQFKKDDNFLYEYIQFGCNKSQQLKISGSTFPIKYYVPVEISQEDVDGRFSKFIIEKTDEQIAINIYAFEETWDLSDMKKFRVKADSFFERQKIINTKLRNCVNYYIKVADKWILNQIYDYEWQKTIEKMREHQTKFLLVDQNGKILDNSKEDAKSVLKLARDTITHENMYNYFVEEPRIGAFSGKVFILDESKALLFPEDIYPTLAHINRLNYLETKHNCLYVYSPKIENPIISEQQWREYFNACRIIEVGNFLDDEKKKLDIVIEHYLEKYNNEYQDSSELPKYLESNLKNIFNNLTFTLTEFENVDFLIAKLMTNQHINQASADEQGDVIKFYFNMFYSTSIVRKDILLANGKNDKLCLKSTAFPCLWGNMYADLFAKDKRGTLNNFAHYRDELYFFLCSFLIYTNLIYNNFDDDITYRKSKLSDSEINRLRLLLTDEIFADFNKINKKDKTQSKVCKLQDKLDVISNMRNCVAHYEFYVKMSKNGKPEDHTLIFVYNKDQKRPNTYFNITVKNFIKFITNPIFVNYKPYNYNYIETNSFDSLIDNVASKIKQYKKTV